jgi:hypothetical protein
MVEEHNAAIQETAEAKGDSRRTGARFRRKLPSLRALERGPGCDDRRRWGTKRLPPGQQGPRPKAPPSGGCRRLGARSHGPQVQGARRRRHPTAAGGRADRALVPQAPVGGRRLPRPGQEVGRGGPRAERRRGSQAPKPVLEKVAKIWAEERAKEGKEVDRQRLMPPRGSRPLPHR